MSLNVIKINDSKIEKFGVIIYIGMNFPFVLKYLRLIHIKLYIILNMKLSK